MCFLREIALLCVLMWASHVFNTLNWHQENKEAEKDCYIGHIFGVGAVIFLAIHGISSLPLLSEIFEDILSVVKINARRSANKPPASESNP